MEHIRIALSFKFAFIWIPYEYFVLCYAAYIKCCDCAGRSSEAGTYSTHLLSLRWRVFQKLLHCTDTKFYIDMVLKRTALIVKCDLAIILEHIRIALSFKFALIWIPYEYFVLCYAAYIKCCDCAWRSSEAGTYSTHLLSLRWHVIQKSLHCTDNKIYIDMVLKRTALFV